MKKDKFTRSLDWRAGALPTELTSPILAPPNKDIDKNRETANIGLVSSVGRAPARQSGDRRFKSRFSKFFFVYPKFI